MAKNIFIKNIHWFIIGILSSALFIISQDILFVIVPFLVTILANFVGNYFLIEDFSDHKKILKTVMIGMISTLIVGIVSIKSLNEISTLIQSIGVILVITILISNFVEKSVQAMFKKGRLLLGFVKKYILRITLLSLFGIIAEIAILKGIISVNNPPFITIILVFFWIISATCIILFRFTEFVFKEKISDIMSIFKIYGVFRISYFLLAFTIIKDMHIFLIIYFFIVTYFGFMVALAPYIYQSPKLKATIVLLQEIYNNQGIKRNKLRTQLNMDEKEFNRLVLKMKWLFFIKQEGKKLYINQNYHTVIKPLF